MLDLGKWEGGICPIRNTAAEVGEGEGWRVEGR